MAITYSNPRTEATIENWPSGKKTVTARFSIERHPKRGERAARTTNGKPKTLTYAVKVRIVDGDDGRTYLAHFHRSHITIMRGTMDYEQEQAFPDNPRYAELVRLFQ